LEKIEPLAKENPEEYQADSANVLLSIGQNYALLEKYRDAEIYYFRSLKIQELLAKKNPDDFPTGLYNVSWCLSVIYSILEDYPNAIHYNNVGKELLFKHKETIDYKPHLAQNYGNLSWCYLFTKEYSQSEQSAHRALELDSINFSKTNLAHALLFQNRFSEAEAIYKELSQTVYTENKTYTPALLDDFNKLEKAGVIPEERKEDVERIRKLLNE
jgi:tetratricopeptide (TPR) repeat protein